MPGDGFSLDNGRDPGCDLTGINGDEATLLKGSLKDPFVVQNCQELLNQS